MNKESKIAKEKDDVLRMAKDRMTIHKSESDPDRYERVLSLAYTLKNQGYINLLDTTGGVLLWLTDEGKVFLENGGYEHKNNSTKRTFVYKWCYDILWKVIIPIGTAIVIGIILWRLGIKN